MAFEIFSAAEEVDGFEIEDPVSKVISYMIGNQKYEVLVFEKQVYMGILDALSLAQKTIYNPDSVKIGSVKTSIRRIEPFTKDDSINGVISSLLINGFRSVPFEDNGRLYILQKLRLLEFLDKDTIRGRLAKDVMTYPYCVSQNDDITVTHALLKDSHTSRVVVLDRSNRAIGFIDALSVLKTFQKKERAKTGEVIGRKKESKVLASSPAILNTNFIRAAPSERLSSIVARMVSENKSTVIVEDKSFEGIITPTSLLKLVKQSVAGIYVVVSGQQEEDDFIKSVIDEQIRNEMKKLGKIVDIDHAHFHVERHRKSGNRIKYSIKARLSTQLGFFYASDFAWDITKAMRGVLQKCEREILKKKTKSEKPRRAP